MFKPQIKLALLSALAYFACVCLAVIIDLFVLKVTNMYNTPAMTALLASFLYMKVLKRTNSFGVISFIGLVMSLFFFFSGHFVFAVVPNIVCGLLADMIAKNGNYKNNKLNLVSYAIFSLGNLAPLMTMWVAPKAYAAQLLAEGKNQAYIDSVLVPLTVQHVLILVGGVLLAAVIGGFISQKIVK